MASAKDELDALVNAPVSGDTDPTLWLPDELMEMIFLMAPFEELWGGVCERVCQRWTQIVLSLWDWTASCTLDQRTARSDVVWRG